MSEPSILTRFPQPTVCAYINKPVKICHRSCKRILKEKTPLLHKFVCFSDAFDKNALGEIFYYMYLSEKLLLSQNLCYFKGSRFSQSSIQSTAHCFMLTIILSNFQVCPVPLRNVRIHGKVLHFFSTWPAEPKQLRALGVDTRKWRCLTTIAWALAA